MPHAYFLFATLSLIAHLLVVMAVAFYRYRRIRPLAPLLPLHERTRFESHAIRAFQQHLVADRGLRQQFLNDCLGANPWIQQHVDQGGARADACLQKYHVQLIRQLDDQALWRFLELLGVDIDSQRLQQRRQLYHPFGPWCLSTQAVTMIAGLLAAIAMLLLPPWLYLREHRVRIVDGTGNRTVLEQRSLGYQSILASRASSDQIQPIATGDMRRFEDHTVRSTVNYRRLTIQLASLTLTIAGFVWNSRKRLGIRPCTVNA